MTTDKTKHVCLACMMSMGLKLQPVVPPKKVEQCGTKIRYRSVICGKDLNALILIIEISPSMMACTLSMNLERLSSFVASEELSWPQGFGYTLDETDVNYLIFNIGPSHASLLSASPKRSFRGLCFNH